MPPEPPNAAPPRTSFVIPAHNAAGTLPQTLDSVLAQSDGDWEAIVVDDASSDRTAEVAAEAAACDRRFVILRTDASGPRPAGASLTRNIGLRHARGRYVVFLDGDDWIAPEFLERMIAALRDTPEAAAAYCDYQRVMPDGALGWPDSNNTVADAPFDVFARYCAVAIHAIVVERERVLRVGGFDTGLRICEDWDLWQRIAREGGRWAHVPQALAFYRTGPPSLSQDSSRAVADAAIVIRRGFGPDPRVARPDPAHAAGAARGDGKSPEISLAYFALWYAAQDAVRGKSYANLEPALVGMPATDEWVARTAAETLFDAVGVALRTSGNQLATRWPEHGQSIVALIEALPNHHNHPDGARRMLYAFERMVLQYGDLTSPRALKRTLGLRLDLRKLPPTVAPVEGVDRLYVCLHCGERELTRIELGALGAFAPRQWAALAAPKLSGRRLLWLAAAALCRKPTVQQLAATARAARPHLGRRRLRTVPWRTLLRHAAADVWISALPDNVGTSSHTNELRRLREVLATSPVGEPSPVAVQHDGAATAEHDEHIESQPTARRHAYWEAFFRNADPWNYGSEYEREKYAIQLEALPTAPVDRALEVACAEGHFTRLLTPRVRHLVAADISATALGRAAERCLGAGNVEFRRLDLLTDPLPGPMDLIVCSEVLYYLRDEDELRHVVGKLAAALAPGGSIVSAHALLLSDDRTRTGFDWDEPFGMRTISRVFAQAPGLALERSVRTDLYHVDRFVRLDHERPSPPEPRIEHRAIKASIEHEVARSVVHGGAVALRSELARSARSQRMPVLAYHRVAEPDHGPQALARYRVDPQEFERQMAWLRRHGYHAIVSDELKWFLERSHPFVGRPVMITFDDGYQDFAEAAWPVLRRHDLLAEVFVVSDLVGGRAEWDRHFGEPAPLMDAATIAALAGQGVRFGSHLATHRAADGLSTRELAQELLRSRCALERWTGQAPIALAAPFGLTDDRLRQLASECGYRIGLGTHCGTATLGADPMHLPRIEVRGDMALEEFAAELEASR